MAAGLQVAARVEEPPTVIDEGVAVKTQLGLDEPEVETPHAEQVQLGLTVPSLQIIRPLVEQEFDVPPWDEQHPGHAANAGCENARTMKSASIKNTDNRPAEWFDFMEGR